MYGFLVKSKSGTFTRELVELDVDNFRFAEPILTIVIDDFANDPWTVWTYLYVSATGIVKKNSAIEIVDTEDGGEFDDFAWFSHHPMNCVFDVWPPEGSDWTTDVDNGVFPK